MAQQERYTPTPAEIRAACEKFQAGWSDADRAKRAGVEAVPWEAPVFFVDVVEVAEVVEPAV